jgi:hypothetical protein
MTLAVDRPVTAIEKIAGFVASIVLATFSYRWIEKPGKNKAGTTWSSKRPMLLWLGYAAATVAGLAVVANPNEYAYRLPSYLSNADFALLDSNPRSDECFLEAGEARQNGFVPKFCKIGTQGAVQPRAILWGDSASNALQPAVDQALASLRLSGVVSSASGCAPVEGVPYADESLVHSFKHCGEGLGNNTLKFIRESKGLDLVLMHANWARYDYPDLKRDLLPEICELKKMGKNIVLIGQVPYPDYSTPRYWSRMEIQHRQRIDEITFPESASLPLNAVFNSLVKDVAATCGEVPVIDPYDFLCSQGQCYSVRNGKAMFRDGAHLTNAGADQLVAPLQTVIKRAAEL